MSTFNHQCLFKCYATIFIRLVRCAPIPATGGNSWFLFKNNLERPSKVLLVFFFVDIYKDLHIFSPFNIATSPIILFATLSREIMADTNEATIFLSNIVDLWVYCTLCVWLDLLEVYRPLSDLVVDDIPNVGDPIISLVRIAI